MHIAMVTDYYLPTLGGVQTAVKAQKESLEELGHTVRVLAPLHEPSNDSTVIRLPTHRFIKPDGYPFAFGPRALERALRKYCIENKPDILHVHSEILAAYAGLRVGRELGIPIVQTMHGRLDVYTARVFPLPALSTIFYKKIHGRFIPHDDVRITADYPYTATSTAQNMWTNMISQANFADHVVVPSQHFAAKLAEQGVTKPLTVISNGLEKSVIEKIFTPELRTLTPTEPFNIMWCGRVSPEKRPEIFVDAVARLIAEERSKENPRQIRADMFGEGVSFKKLKEQVRAQELEDQIVLHGPVPQDEVLQAMKEHHVFVSSSFDFDNQPMVMLEAAATGLPCVFSDPDLAEVVPAEGGIVAEDPTAAGLGSTLRKFMEHPEKIEAMSQALISGRAQLQQETHTQKLLEVYENALSQAHQDARKI